MDIKEYKHRVITHLKSGNATDAEWEQVAEAVLNASEADCYGDVIGLIDVAIGWRSPEEIQP